MAQSVEIRLSFSKLNSLVSLSLRRDTPLCSSLFIWMNNGQYLDGQGLSVVKKNINHADKSGSRSRRTSNVRIKQSAVKTDNGKFSQKVIFYKVVHEITPANFVEHLFCENISVMKKK
jgi:hypothetical protein